MMKRCTLRTFTRFQSTGLLLLLLLPLLLNNTACTMFLIKEGYKEVKKLEEEKKEKKEREEQQWQNEQLPARYDTTPEVSNQPQHHGQWTPQREE